MKFLVGKAKKIEKKRILNQSGHTMKKLNKNVRKLL